MRSTLLPALVPLLPLAACTPSTIVVGEVQEITVMKAIPNRNLDILFVVDNSPSMIEQQRSLAENFPRMMEVLELVEGGLPSLHIGVITSDMGTLGSSSSTPGPSVGQIGQGGCAGRGFDGRLMANSPALSGASFISDVEAPDGSRIRNYTGDLRDVFSQIAQVGQGGCGFEQHLAATRRALENPLNGGFLRQDANLAVVIIADEDDCSVLDPAFFGPESPELGSYNFRCPRHGVVCDPDDTSPGLKDGCVPRASSTLVEDVQPFVDALLAVKPDPRMVMVAGIVGDPKPFAIELRPPPGGGSLQPMLVPSCTFQGPNGPETADPAVRIAAFLDAFPGRSELLSICSPDLSPPLVTIGGTAKKLVADPCLDSQQLVDASPDPGLQPACEVTDVLDSDPDRPRYLPGCAPGATDCFEIVSDANVCPTAPENLRVRIRRSAVTDDTWTHVRCQLRK